MARLGWHKRLVDWLGALVQH
jgi:hypothetical protein